MKLFLKMTYIVLLLLLGTFLGLIIYTYRWNITNPNKSHSVTVDNYTRRFIYHIPKQLSPNPKLIIAYHGSKLKGFMMQIFTGHEFDLLADKYKDAIIVYPEGYKGHWNDCRKEAPFEAKQKNLNDVEFTQKIIDFFKTEYSINEKEIFAVGYSNGGFMVFRLANEKSSVFKSFAVISSNLPVNANYIKNNLQSPISLIYFSGMKDEIVPYEGGEVFVNEASYGFVRSTQETLDYWLNVNNSDSSNAIAKFKNKNEEITAIKTDYFSNSSGKKISVIKMFDGGHTIPNQNFRLPIKAIGKMNKEVDAPQLIWDFFMDK
ncbi:alpha/beta hydrolase family esterase [Parafilimonas sp.]|uniref:alpha/beta hydrolase family esterase n=1 Tax=Parafilimonas sp. TaxID=1969739 RepID=UPI0039E72A3B